MKVFACATTVFQLVSIVVVSDMTGQTSTENEQIQGVTETVNAYFKGGTDGDIESFRRAFHPQTNVIFAEDGEYRSWTFEEYLGLWTPGKRSERATSILELDVTGNTASAKVEARYSTHRFIDYLSLLRLGDEWKIVGKIFYREDY